MTIIYLFIFVMLFIISPYFRAILFHPISTIYYMIKDTYLFFRYRRYNEYRKFGTLTIFNGLFGKGKTLSSTYFGRKIYKKWNNKKIYDFKEKKWKIQKIVLVSNVEIKDVPYVQLYSLTDIIKLSEYKDKANVMTIWVVLVDEMSTQINSREYKTNFSTELLNVMLTCRHYRMQMIGSAQRFAHVDALVRQITSDAIECKKLWRLVEWDIYDAWTIENTSDVTKIKPKRRKAIFVKDKDFNAYDTVAVVENFKDNVKAGKILTDKEVLEAQGLLGEAENNRANYKRRFRKKINK